MAMPELAYFRLGCQGPDIFYHNQRTKPSGLHYGALAHKRRYGSLIAAMADSLEPGERSPASPLGAYVLGLATHAALDRKTHPFIISRSGWAAPGDEGSKKRRGCHAFYERLLDRELLALRETAKPEDFGIAGKLGLGTALDPTEDAALVSLWAAGISVAYPKAAQSDGFLEKRIENALADARYFFVTTDPELCADGASSGWRAWLLGEDGSYLVSILYPLLPHEALDALNMRKESWPLPTGGGESRASYPELMAEGEGAAAEALVDVGRFWAGEIPASELAARIGETSLSLDGPALYSSPLDLPEAMAAELAARRERALRQR
jgi:hypothetical protein